MEIRSTAIFQSLPVPKSLQTLMGAVREVKSIRNCTSASKCEIEIHALRLMCEVTTSHIGLKKTICITQPETVGKHLVSFFNNYVYI